ncbi:MOSC domain-containing protein [Cryptosporangium minutisporangium]|uniref:MOSC domain-containing protein n=1 Tax=Cryptosporangium minutisporangium TaxID=113569 RepID=UPI0031EAE314
MPGSAAAPGPPRSVGRVTAIARYPVKSLAGERLRQAPVTERGVAGDRWWAAYTADGGIASGKTTRRFRRVERLFALRARLPEPTTGDDAVPRILFPDGDELRADAPAASARLSAVAGRDLVLRPQTSIRHHDESAVHLITTAAVRRLAQLRGEPVDPARFRANLELDVEGVGFPEDDWAGCHLVIGDDVELCLGPAMPRCVMVGNAQPHAGLGDDPRLLKTIGRHHGVTFGLQATVVRTGTACVGDTAMLIPPP